MCELYGFMGKHEQNITPYLLEFFSHGDKNPHGWGLADLSRSAEGRLETEAVRADVSRLLPHIIKDQRPTKLLLAHIRYGTVGGATLSNCHPFTFQDYSGVRWTFMHNGTIFQGAELGRYQPRQRGTTDSERILLYLIDRLNDAYVDGQEQTDAQRRAIIEDVIRELSPSNKLNLLFSDGVNLYVHVNMKNTLFRKREGDGVQFATVPLDGEEWTPVELCRLLVYRDGALVYTGPAHENEYISGTEPEMPGGYDAYTGGTDMRDYWLDRAIWHKYIIPTQRRPGRFVGVEFEFPIVNLERRPVDFSVVHALSEDFVRHFRLDHEKRDDDGHIYNAFSSVSGDDLSFDCSYNTLELSFGKEEDINDLYARFCGYYRYIQDYLLARGHTLTGMGINPRWDVNRNDPITSERYRMLLHHLESYKKYDGHFHDHPNFGLFSCASQVQLDVGRERVPLVLNTFNRLEPLKSVLFANSYWQETDQLCARDDMWRKSLHGLNPHNVGEYEVELRESADVIQYIKSMSIYCMERAGKYINFAPMPLREYFARDFVTGEYFDGEVYRPITFTPELEDLQFLRSFKFEDLTFRGTVEFRSVCQQPVRDIMSVAAFHAGLMERADELDALLRADRTVYGKGYTPAELRRLLNRAEWPAFIRRDELSALLTRVLDLARAGLSDRGRDETRFLAPLYERAETLVSPAARMREDLRNGRPAEELIREFAAIGA